MARNASSVEVGAATRMKRALASALEPLDASEVREITTIALVVEDSASVVSAEPATVPAQPSDAAPRAVARMHEGRRGDCMALVCLTLIGRAGGGKEARPIE
jgi:hypothetical protein